MELPDTRYVSVGDADVAYQIVGEGPRDILFCNSLGGHVDLLWQLPPGAKFLNELSSLGRVLHMDRRGCGASDAIPVGAVPTWETLAEDMTAVLDAASSKLTDVVGVHEVGPIAVLFAAMHPDRVRSLILINTAARYLEADDYPIGVAPTAFEALMDLFAATWGTEDNAELANPGRVHDREFIRGVARTERASATPQTATAQFRYFLGNMDVRAFLPLVQCPTLVLHAKQTPFVPLALGQYLADEIPGATLIAMPGGDLYPPYGPDTVLDIAEFFTGERPSSPVDRVLTTILFTDIVGSTETAASLGDSRWRTVLDAHDRAVREQLHRIGGREVKHTGDGFLISFDGPARGIRCAKAISEAAKSMGIEIRAGLHTGECEVRGDDLGGMAVHIAARVNALAAPGEILVTSTVKDLVIGSGMEFTERGEHILKGVPESWVLFSAAG